MGEKQLFMGTFEPLQELGRGGMGAVYKVRAVPDAPGSKFPQFLADMVAWREATSETALPKICDSIAEKRAKLEQLVSGEMSMQDSNASIGNVKELQAQIIAQKQDLANAIEFLKTQQFKFVGQRKQELLAQYDTQSLTSYLADQGINLPEDLVFAMKLAFTKPAQMEDANYQALLGRLQTEWKSLINLQHPNIVEVFSGGNNYYVMEFMKDKKSSREVIEHFTNEQKLRIALDVANAMEYSHSRGVLHRDIKPDNVFVTGNGTKVGDFGLAKSAVSGGNTQSNTAMGTFKYMSPDQVFDSKRCDERADVYSLGATLYHYLTGRAPISSKNELGEELGPMQMAKRVVTAQIIPPSEVVPGTPRDLSNFVMAMLAKERSQRVQSMTEAKQFLEQYLSVEDAAALRSVSFANVDTSSLKHRGELKVRQRQKVDEDEIGLEPEKPNHAPKYRNRKTPRGAPRRARQFESKNGNSSKMPKWLAASIGAVTAGIAIVGGAIYSTGGNSNGKVENPTPLPPVPTVVDPVPAVVDNTPDYAKQYRNEVVPRAADLKAGIDDFLKSGSTDLGKLKTLDDNLKDIYQKASEFKEKDVAEAVGLLREQDEKKKKKDSRASLIKDYQAFSEGFALAGREITQYVKPENLGKATVEGLEDLTFKLKEAKGRQDFFRSAGLSFEKRNFSAYETMIAMAMQNVKSRAPEVVEPVKVEPKGPSEEYIAFEKQAVDISKSIKDFLNSNSFDREQIKSLSEKLAEASKQAGKYKEEGVKEAEALVEELGSYQPKLAEVSEFVKDNVGVIAQLSRLEDKIETTMQESPYDTKELNALKRSAGSYLYRFGNTIRRNGAIGKRLGERLKSHLKTIDEQIEAAKSPFARFALGLTFDEGTVVYNQQEKAWYVLDQGPNKNHGKIHGKFAGDERAGKPMVFASPAQVPEEYDLALVRGPSGKPNDFAMYFAGKEGYIEIADNNSLDLNRDFEIILQFISATNDKQQSLISKWVEENYSYLISNVPELGGITFQYGEKGADHTTLEIGDISGINRMLNLNIICKKGQIYSNFNNQNAKKIGSVNSIYNSRNSLYIGQTHDRVGKYGLHGLIDVLIIKN